MRIFLDDNGQPTFEDEFGQPMEPKAAVKLLRKQRELTTADLAFLAWVSPRTIEGWEQGRPISPSCARTLATIIEKDQQLSFVGGVGG